MATVQEIVSPVVEESSNLENTQVVEININELLEDHAKFNEHDTILSPIEKFDEDIPFESNNDSVSTATDRSQGSKTPEKPKRRVFSFDVAKVFSFSQNKEKKTPVKEEKPAEELNIIPEEKKPKSEEKKLKSEEKKLKSEEKAKKIETIKSQFVLFGQVINHNYLIEKEPSDLLTQVIEEEPIKIEADPSHFAIDDESPAKQPEKPIEKQPEVKQKVETKENKNTPTKPSKAYEVIPFKSTEFFKGEKENKKSGFANFFKSKLQRFIGFQDKHLIVGEKIKEEIRIKSKTPISKLFQISIERENPKKLILLFNDQPFDMFTTPVKKTYKIENLQQFMDRLKDEVDRVGKELRLNYSSDFKL